MRETMLAGNDTTTRWCSDNFEECIYRRGYSLFLVRPKSDAFVVQFDDVDDRFYFMTPDGAPMDGLLSRLRKHAAYNNRKRCTGMSPYWKFAYRKGIGVVFQICNWLIQRHSYYFMWGTDEQDQWERELQIAREMF